MPSTASSSTRAIKQGKSKKFVSIEKQHKNAERHLNRQFVALHNGMVTTMNTEYERCREAHAQEVEDRTKEYNAYLGLMRSCAMRHLGGTKAAPRYLKYLDEVGAAFSQHKKANPRKARNKHLYAFKRMPSYEEEEEEEAEDTASETLDEEEEDEEEEEEEEEEVVETTSSEESEEESDEALQEPVRLPAKAEPARVAPKKDKGRVAPKTNQVRVVAPKLTLTLKRK